MQQDQLLLKTMTGGAAVTPSDVADLPRNAQALYIGGTGDLKVTTIGGDTLTFSAVPVGLFDVGTKRVFATGTTASNIIALYNK